MYVAKAKKSYILIEPGIINAWSSVQNDGPQMLGQVCKSPSQHLPTSYPQVTKPTTTEKHTSARAWTWPDGYRNSQVETRNKQDSFNNQKSILS